MIAVIMGTITGREDMLEEAKASVRAQTIPVKLYLHHDKDREGVIPTLNRMARKAIKDGADWLIPLADDDTIDPDYAEQTLALSHEADVVYTQVNVEGFDTPVRPYDPDLLEKQNYIPSTTLIRAALWKQLGGYRDCDQYEDWDLWLRAKDAGARFVYHPVKLWTYRANHGTNQNPTEAHKGRPRVRPR